MKIFSKLTKKSTAETKTSSEDYIYEKLKTMQVSSNINDNIKILDDIFSNNTGILRRSLTLGISNIPILVIYIEGMINKELLTQNIITPITTFKDTEVNINELNNRYFEEKVITSSNVQEAVNYDILVYELLSGSTIIFVDGLNTSFIVGNTEVKGRNVEKTDTEQTIRGGKAGFVEDLHTNIILIRKMIKTPDLAVEIVNVGKRSKTNIAVMYLKGVINKDLPQEIKKRLAEINIDGITDSSQVQAIIQKHKWTMLPQMLATERVDRIISAILEGRAALIVDGTPYVLVVPTTINLFLSTPDDYYGRTIVNSLLRIIRYMGFFIACSISALYLALTTYHPGLIPTALVLSITGTRGGVPFPVALEIIIMELALYLIQEAAIRLPKVVGQTVGIVGGLVLGQSVVQAGIVSPVIVIIVSMSAISSFTLPNYTFALSTIGMRLFLVFCSMLLGLYGFVVGATFLLIHAASLESFGVKYLSDFSPYNRETLKDTIIIAPQYTVFKRPDYLKTEDTIKSDFDTKDDFNE